IALKPDYLDAYNNRGFTYAELRQYDKALVDYTKAIALRPGQPSPYSNRAVVYADLQQYDQAIADYAKAIALKPDWAEAYYNRGVIYADLKQYDRAIADCTKTIELKPDYAQAYLYRGLAYTELKRYDQALADYTKAIELGPDCAELYCLRGRVYADLKQYDKAIADHKRATELKAEFADAWVNLTWNLYLTGRLNEAITAARKGLKRFPDSEYLTGNLAIALLTSGKDEEAVAQYRRLVQIGAQRALDGGCGKDLSDLVVKRPELGLAHFCIGLLYDGAGQKAEAITEYQTYLKAQPQGKYAAESRARLEALQP
ncbi:MAG: tetratricopeptide repeat protein, partial [Armatimonadia bacterium]